MAEIQITIRRKSTGESWRVQLQDDAPVSSLVPALITQLGWPATAQDGSPVTYQLHTADFQAIADDQTLAAAGVQDGDEVMVTEQYTAG